MKIECNTVAFRKYSLDHALNKIAKAGFRYVEVEANLKWCPHPDPYNLEPEDFIKKIASYDFKGVSASGSHRELLSSDQGVRDIEYILKWAGDAGVPVVITGEGRMDDGMQVGDAMDRLKRVLGRLIKVAESSKVVLAMEDHGSISLTPDGLPAIMALYESEWFGVNFDTANIHRGDYVGMNSEKYEWKLGAKTSYSETELLTKVVDKVRHSHIKDVKGRDAVILGHGEIDLIRCVKILNNAGYYEGILSYETEGWEESDEAEEMIGESRTSMERNIHAR